VTLTNPQLVRDEGTVVVLSGTDESTGRSWLFGVDRRAAYDILNDDEAFLVQVETWQLLGPARG